MYNVATAIHNALSKVSTIIYKDYNTYKSGDFINFYLGTLNKSGTLENSEYVQNVDGIYVIGRKPTEEIDYEMQDELLNERISLIDAINSIPSELLYAEGAECFFAEIKNISIDIIYNPNEIVFYFQFEINFL